MIRKVEPISMAEASEYFGKEQEEIKEFIKRFTELTPSKAKNLREKLRALNIMKMDERHISKIIDILPSSQEEVNKIFSEVPLEEDESKKIIEVVSQFD